MIVVLNPDSEDALSSNLRVRGAMSQAVTIFAYQETGMTAMKNKNRNRKLTKMIKTKIFNEK